MFGLLGVKTRTLKKWNLNINYGQYAHDMQFYKGALATVKSFQVGGGPT